MISEKKILVIGAGAAGMMAAITAAKNNSEVILFEKNKIVGKKIRITGKGRCNLTNNCTEQNFISSIPSNGKFLYSAINEFTPQDTMNFFKDNNLELKVERGNRVFPVSDNATDVAETLKKVLNSSNCKIINQQVKKLLIEDSVCKGVETDSGEKFLSDATIIATGGLSYPGTGSTGDGYKFAKQAGHTLNELIPSLVPLISNQKFCKKLQGLSLKNVGIQVLDKIKEKIIYKDFGEMLFTHFGVSGPIILSASSHMKNMMPNRYSIIIDLKPALDEMKLDKRLQRDFEMNINRDFINSLKDLLPKKLIPVIVGLSKIESNTKCNQITKDMRYNLVKLLKNFTIDIEGFRPIEEAVVTSGGVSVLEINPKTMESKVVKSLYFAGEVIDVDAYTGGYNLQIAFSTGVLAGKSASSKGSV
ncbi:MAG: 3-dehydro-bile acid delta(4,6)-reductase [Eubacteriales bacterium SKADARSKE-1]|nr:3-dehydro-bile acid delta(4,6)-reductase [Eubacteriales bacterium SKADARSKE-1]